MILHINLGIHKHLKSVKTWLFLLSLFEPRKFSKFSENNELEWFVLVRNSWKWKLSTIRRKGLFREKSISGVLGQKALGQPIRLYDYLTILTWKSLCFAQFSIRMAAWLLLTFFVCLHNQLSPIHSIIVY